MSNNLDEHFSPIAREILHMAQVEAARLRHPEVEPEHLLIALSAHQKAKSAAMFRELNVDVPRLQKELRQAAGTPSLAPFKSATYSARLQRALVLAADEARVFSFQMIGSQHLLAGVIREGSGQAKGILTAHGVSLYGVHRLLRTLDFRDGDALPAFDISKSPLMRNPTLALLRRLPISVSPLFLAIVGATALAAALAYLAILPRLFALLFIIGGWVISVCLHEFGHAAMAYLGGDVDVANKGYLTFDPRRYTHPILSIVFPIFFVLLGGIPLPGGAVYINEHLIRTRRMRSLTSAAGPAMTLVSAFILWVPLVIFRPTAGSDHTVFWGAWAFLMYLEILALFINLLPIPGLDGFAIIEHYLPLNILNVANRIRPYGMLILLAFFMLPNPIKTLLYSTVNATCSLLGVDMGLVITGMSVLPRLF